jgi:hypothetical protein
LFKRKKSEKKNKNYNFQEKKKKSFYLLKIHFIIKKIINYKENFFIIIINHWKINKVKIKIKKLDEKPNRKDKKNMKKLK